MIAVCGATAPKLLLLLPDWLLLLLVAVLGLSYALKDLGSWPVAVAW
jgi:hypothetical protein